MSLDQFVGQWEFRWQGEGDSKRYKPGRNLLIGRHDAGACSLAWLDEDDNLCTLSGVGYDEAKNHLHGRCTGQAGSHKQVDYFVDISFLFGTVRAINGVVRSVVHPSNDDPLAGLWTADRRPGSEEEEK